MLRRLAARGFKSLVDVDIQVPRLAVLAGPNAAGKSNLLDAIQLLARAGTQRTLAEAFAEPIRGFPTEAFTLPMGGLQGLLEQPNAQFEIEADLDVQSPGSNGRSPDRFRYCVTIEIDPDAGALSVADEYLAALDSDWQPKQRPQPRIERDGDNLVLRRASERGRPPHERLGLGHTLLSDTRNSGSSYRPLELVRTELRRWRSYYLDPQGAMRAAQPPRQVTDIGVHGKHLAPFLYGLKMQREAEFLAVKRSLRDVVPTIDGLDVDLDTKRGTLDIQIEQDGTTFSSRVISEGTLRVLALCAIAVTATNGMVAFEEPENGVQPQRIDRIAQLLTSSSRQRGGAQVVITTHSPELVAAMLQESRKDGGEVGLLGVARNGRETIVRRIKSDPRLWQEPALEELLSEPAESDKIAAVVRRGWLDL